MKMNNKLTVISFVVVSFLTITQVRVEAQSIEANSVGLIINEVMPNPIGSDTDGEWIEILNTSTGTISLQDYKFDGVALDQIEVSPGEIFLIVRNKNFIQENNPEIISRIIESNFALNNSSDLVTLTNNINSNTLEYSSSTEGISIEKDCNDNTTNFGTPHSMGKRNSSCENLTLQINRDGDWDENLSVFNDIDYSLTILEDFTNINWKINSNTFQGKSITTKFEELGEQLITVEIDEPNLSFIKEFNITVYPRIKFSEIFGNPDGSDTGNEWIELYNKSNTDQKNWILEDLTSSEIISINNKEYPVIQPNKVTINNTYEVLSLKTPSGLISDQIKIDSIDTGMVYTNFDGVWKMVDYFSKGSVNEFTPLVEELENIDLNTSSYGKPFSRISSIIQEPIEYNYPERISTVYKLNSDNLKLTPNFTSSEENNIEIIFGNLFLIISGTSGILKRILLQA